MPHDQIAAMKAMVDSDWSLAIKGIRLEVGG